MEGLNRPRMSAAGFQRLFRGSAQQQTKMLVLVLGPADPQHVVRARGNSTLNSP